MQQRETMQGALPYPAALPYPVEPVFKLEGDFSPFDVWLECRAARQLWQKGYEQGVTDEDRLRSVLCICARLASFPARRWLVLNSALGWTPEAAAIQTWCQDAALSDTVEICNQLQYLACAQQNADFCARVLNPALLPPNQLSQVVKAGGRQLHGVAFLIAARADMPQVDVSKEILQNFPPHLLSMLQERCGQTTALSAAKTAAQPDTASSLPQAPAKPSATAAEPPGSSAPTKQRAPAAAGRRITPVSDMEKYQDQIERIMHLRHWTEDMLAAAKATPASSVMVEGYGECYRYVHPENGATIVVSAVNGALLHAGRADFAYRLNCPHKDIAADYTDPLLDQQSRKTMIWVPLKYEPVDVWCPVPASYMERDIYCILPSCGATREEPVLYAVTAYVHCRPVMFDDGVHMAAAKAASL